MGKKGEKEKDKPGFVRAYEKDQQQQKEDLAKQLSIRERLMRHVKQTVVNVSFTDDLGIFHIKCRSLTEREQRDLIALQDKLADIKTIGQYDKAIEKLRKILAYPDGICRDPGLDLKFWKEGNYSISDMLRILVETSQQIGDVESFRKK